MTPWRTTLGTSVALAAGAVAVLGLALARDGSGTPFGPGELDVLLAARSMAAGVVPPLWVGAVHPDATGTWLGALVLSPLLRLGLPDVVALKLLAGLHFALLVGCSAGMATRRAGVAAGALAGAILALGAPALVAAHSKYLATTVEVLGLQIGLLWATLELLAAKRASLVAVAAIGAGLGVALVYSLHSAVLAGVVGLALLWARRDRWRTALALCLPALLPLAWFAGLRDATGPSRGPLSVKTLSPGQLLGLLDPTDLATLLTRAPFALLSDTEHIPPDAWVRLLHVPLAISLGAALLGATALATARRLPRHDVVVLAYGLGTAAPLLIAGDLLGYPAAYRYFLPLLPPAAVLLATAVTRGLRRGPPRTLAVSAVVAMTAPGLWTTPRSTATELSRPMASYVAGQHRLGFARAPLHTHFLMLTPFVRDDELSGWLQGYGVHLGREFTRQAPIAAQEARDQRPDPGPGAPEFVDLPPHNPPRSTRAGGAVGLGAAARRDLLLGVGLGVAEDGVLDAFDCDLVGVTAGRDRAAVWQGVGAALGERWFWTGNASPLRVRAPMAPLDASSMGALAAGLSSTGGRSAPSVAQWVDADLLGPAAAPMVPQGRLAHPHPFTYADVGVLGRGEVPMGPR